MLIIFLSRHINIFKFKMDFCKMNMYITKKYNLGLPLHNRKKSPILRARVGDLKNVLLYESA